MAATATPQEEYDEEPNTSVCSNDPTTPVPPQGKRKRGPVTTPNTMNDEAELARRRRRRQSLAFQQRRKSLTPSKSTTTTTNGSTPPKNAVNRQYISDMYSTIIQMSSENKINVKNSWSLHLIDHMQDILSTPTISTVEKEDDDATYNFQKASCTLDASVKIYSYRVDDTWNSSYKILENLSRNAHAKRTSGGNEEEENDEQEDTEATETSSKPKARKSKKAPSASTIEKNLNNINLKTHEVEVDVDPMFHKMSQAFDEGGAKGMLLANLSVFDGCKILLNSNDVHAMTCMPLHKQAEEEEAEEQEEEKAVYVPQRIPLAALGGAERHVCFTDKIHTMDIGPSMLSELYDQLGVAVDGRSTSLRSTAVATFTRQTLLNNALEAQGYEEHSDHGASFEMNTTDMSMELDGGDVVPDSHDDALDEHDDHDDGVMDVEMEDVDYETMEPSVGTEEIKPEPNVIKTEGKAVVPMSSIVTTATEYFDAKEQEDQAATHAQETYTLILENALLRAVTAQTHADAVTTSTSFVNDYSYFDMKLLKNWSGPAHWKFPRLRSASTKANAKASQQQQSSQNEDEMDHEETKAATRKRSRKHVGTGFVDFFAEAPDVVKAFQTPRSEASITMSKLVINRQATKAADLVFPVDAHIEIKLFYRHFAKSRLRFFAKTKATANNNTGGSQEYPHEIEDHDDGMPVEHVGDDNEHYDHDDGEDGAGFECEDHDDETAFESQANDGLLYGDHELLSAERVVQRVDVQYERVAKRVDVKKLKQSIWTHLETETEVLSQSQSQPTPSEPENEEAMDEFSQDFNRRASLTLSQPQSFGCSQGETTFESVVQHVADKVPSNITVSFYFICMLHLANEKGLELVGQDDLRDFQIRKDHACL